MSLPESHYTVKKKNLVRKKSFLFFLGFFSLLVILVGFFLLNPVGFRRSLFQPIREISYFQKDLEPLTHWKKIRKVTVPKGREVFITEKGIKPFTIAADLRLPEGNAKAPAIALLHGSSPWGRKEGLIQYLAFRLNKDGWITLAPDARGFGETEDPKEISSPLAWDVKKDVRTCLTYLYLLPRTDPKRIYVFGHSMGAGHALVGALNDQRVKALILVGPPRYINKRLKTTFWNRIRFSAERGLEKPISLEVVKKNMQALDLSNYINGKLSKKGHKPILLIDGEKEGRRNLNFLRQKASRIKPSLKYRTLSGTGHYCGVYNFYGADTIYLRPDMFDPFYNLLLSYFAETESGGEQ